MCAVCSVSCRGIRLCFCWSAEPRRNEGRSIRCYPLPPTLTKTREREREVKHSQCHVPVVTVQARTGSLVLFLSECNVEKRGMHCGSPPSQRRCLPLRRTAATCLVQAIIYLFLSTAKERSSFGSITPAHD